MSKFIQVYHWLYRNKIYSNCRVLIQNSAADLTQPVEIVCVATGLNHVQIPIHLSIYRLSLVSIFKSIEDHRIKHILCAHQFHQVLHQISSLKTTTDFTIRF